MPTKKTPTKTPAKKRMGRPPKAPGELRVGTITVRIRPDDKQVLQAAARATGMSVSTFIISTALERGEVDNVACSFVTREGAVGTFFVLIDERERPWELLGAVEYLKGHLIRSLGE